MAVWLQQQALGRTQRLDEGDDLWRGASGAAAEPCVDRGLQHAARTDPDEQTGTQPPARQPREQ